MYFNTKDLQNCKFSLAFQTTFVSVTKVFFSRTNDKGRKVVLEATLPLRRLLHCTPCSVPAAQQNTHDPLVRKINRSNVLK